MVRVTPSARLAPSWTIMTVALAAMVPPLMLAGCARATQGPAYTEETPTPPEEPSTAARKTISHGEEVDLEDHLVAGKITIFDFYSDYCPPCHIESQRLEELVKRREDIAVVKVDINRPGRTGIDWESPVARQHSLHSIPHFIIYDADGRVMAEGREARRQAEQWRQE